MPQPDHGVAEADVVDVTGLTEVSSGAHAAEGMIEHTTHTAELAGISRHDCLIRAQSWIAEHVMYSQTQYHKNQYGNYRQDCSGYVSMCWHLPLSYTTSTILTVAHRITWPQLQPGDALLRRSGNEGHIGLFVGWADGGHTKPVIDEEYETGHPCSHRVWNHQYASTFTPIRYSHIS